MSRKNPFKGSKEVKAKKAALEKINKKAKEAAESIKRTIGEFQQVSKNINPDNYIERLPIETLRESQDYDLGRKKLNLAEVLDKRRELNGKILLEKDGLSKLNEEIFISEIDLTLAKIKHLMQQLEEK